MFTASELAARKKVLFPTLFMNAEERKAFEAKMAGSQVVDSNTLGQSADTLWSIVSPEAIDAVSKKYFDLGNTTHVVEGYIPADANIRPKVYVEVITDAGSAIKNATDWESSDMANSYVEVTLNRYSRPFGLSSYDIMHGERIQSKIGAAIEAVVAHVVNDYFATAIASGATPFTVDPATFSPEIVAGQVSALFGGYGPVDDLILDPTLWAKLVPTNALGLGTAPGTYGIEYLHRTAGLNMTPAGGSALTATKGTHGVAVRRNGIVAGFGLPMYDETTGIAVRSLGTVAGIPLLLKTWTKKGQEVIYNSVETMAGFAVGNVNSIALLQDSATVAAAAGEGTDPSGD